MRTRVAGLDKQATKLESQLEAACAYTSTCKRSLARQCQGTDFVETWHEGRDRDVIRAECQTLASEKASLSTQLEGLKTRLAEAERRVAESTGEVKEQRDAQAAVVKEAGARQDAALKVSREMLHCPLLQPIGAAFFTQDQQKLFDTEREQLRSQHLANMEAKHAELMTAKVENGVLTGAKHQLQLRCTGAETALAAVKAELAEAQRAHGAETAKVADITRIGEAKEAELLKLQVRIDELQKAEAEKQELKQRLHQANAEAAEAQRLKEEAANAHALAEAQNEEAIEAWRAELQTAQQAAQERVSIGAGASTGPVSPYIVIQDAQAAQAQAVYEAVSMSFTAVKCS